MRRLSLLLPVLVVSAAAPAHAAPEHAEIAFAGGGQIWAARADGSERRALGRGEQPAWSPDGSRLAYVRGTEDESQILLLGTGELTPLRRGVSDQSPAWSPDGTALAFSRFTVRNQRYRSSIVVADVASGAERVLVTKRLFPRWDVVGEPAWSPDGTTIAFTQSRIDREHDIRPDVRTIPAGGGTSRLVIRDAQSPAWSPGGDRLAFSGIRDRNGKRCSSDECWFAGELYTAAADGGDRRRLTRNEGDDRSPRWSPDGSRLLFTSDRTLPEGDSGEVYSVAADGSCLTWVTNGSPASGDATWRPGSGGRYDPGSCDPAARAPVVDPPRLPKRPGLWLGPRYGDLLASRFENGILFYDDCARFAGCGGGAYVFGEPACRWAPHPRIDELRTWRIRGALVTYRGGSRASVYSGRTATALELPGGGLAAIRRAVRRLRPYDAPDARRRLAAPRLPRPFARRLGVKRYVPCSS